MSSVWFPPDMTLRMRPILFFVRPENLVSHSLESHSGAFLQTASRLLCLSLRRGFCLATAIKLRSVECCTDGFPSGRFSHPQTGSLERSQTDHLVLGHLSYEGPSHLIAQFGRQPTLGSVLVVPNFFHLSILSVSTAGSSFQPHGLV